MTGTSVPVRPTANWKAANPALYVAVCVVSLLLGACIDPMVSTIQAATETENTPGVTTVPDSGSLVAPDQEIMVRFSESMKRNSVTFGGTILEHAAAPAWASVIDVDDAIVLEPSDAWPLYEGFTLTVEATSLRGYRSRRSNSDFTAVDERIHVSASATAETGENAIGTPSDPLPTIDAALERAGERRNDGFRDTQVILVAAGHYEASLALIPNVELYGGYEDGFQSRTPRSTVVTGANGASATLFIDEEGEPVTYSLLNGFELQQPGGSEAVATITIAAGKLRIVDSLVVGESVPAIRAEGGLGMDIEGATIVGPTSGATRSAIQVGTPYFRVLQVGTAELRISESHVSIPSAAESTSESVATIRVQKNGSVYIDRTQLFAPAGNVGGAIALQIQDDGLARVSNSLIDGGSGTETQVILHEGGQLFVRNSTIRNGSATSSTARASVGVRSGANAIFLVLPYLVVQNSIFFGDGSANSVGGHFYFLNKVWENNAFHGIDSAAYVEAEFGASWSLTAAEMNSSPDVTASNNVEVDPGLASPLPLGDNAADWSLSASSPGTIKSGGVDLSGLGVEPVDFFGVARGTEWAIGAYEP